MVHGVGFVIAFTKSLQIRSRMAEPAISTLRTGNIWNYANRDDVKAVSRLLDEGIDAETRNKVGWTPLRSLEWRS